MKVLCHELQTPKRKEITLLFFHFLIYNSLFLFLISLQIQQNPTAYLISYRQNQSKFKQSKVSSECIWMGCQIVQIDHM